MVEFIVSSNAFRPLVASKQPMYPISSSDGFTFLNKFLFILIILKKNYKKNKFLPIMFLVVDGLNFVVLVQVEFQGEGEVDVAVEDEDVVKKSETEEEASVLDETVVE